MANWRSLNCSYIPTTLEKLGCGITTNAVLWGLSSIGHCWRTPKEWPKLSKLVPDYLTESTKPRWFSAEDLVRQQHPLLLKPRLGVLARGLFAINKLRSNPCLDRKKRKMRTDFGVPDD